MRTGLSVIAPVFSSVYCCLFYAAGGGGRYLMEHLEVLEEGTWRSLGDRCVAVGGSARTRKNLARYGRGDHDRISIETVSRGRKATVTISTGTGKKVIEFDRAFLRSPESEVTYFASDAGTEYRITHWGERDCAVPPEEFEEAPQAAELRDAQVA